ncbi:MAG: hypothetical protein AB8B69_10570 [Chitinophagales bacterium]
MNLKSTTHYNKLLPHPLPSNCSFEAAIGYHASVLIEGNDEYIIKIAQSMKQGSQTLYDYFIQKNKAAVLGGKYKGMYVVLSRKPVEVDAWRMMVLDGENKKDFDDTMALLRLSLNFRN